ncbi:nitrogen fixation protein NifM [Agarivorans gilvus]|uniref:peptidylprolyl isomerase n=1 Tax=Agarivorans gilvus TaxID=680279 RepID=A0ABQ1I858_9ALTE|nr:nitrogen fixation protein NifM [Agarivorans gilvus]GGB18248.1 hypothetical protein GCM10007414_34590 [Agarivorans gilvus]
MWDETQAYISMKTSLALFQQVPKELSDSQQQELARVVSKTQAIQQRVLSSDEAQQVVIDDAQLDKALAVLQQNFDSSQAYQQALEDNLLSPDALRQAIKNELSSEAVLALVCKDIQPVTEQEAQTFYNQHPEKFRQVARREAHHLLITVNEQFKENTPREAKRRAGELAKKVNPGNFEKLCERHSECPTAVNGGYLGMVEPGSLLPELDKALFNMQEKSFSSPILSSVGYHIVWCKKHVPEHCVSFAEAKAKIQSALLEQAQKRRQKQWLAKLFNQSPLN